jgi:hypothetical protein
MRSRRIFGVFCAALMCLACVGVIPGCGSGVEEIPLAKVAPPPESFYRVQANAKNHRSASPQNANELRR